MTYKLKCRACRRVFNNKYPDKEQDGKYICPHCEQDLANAGADGNPPIKILEKMLKEIL